MAYVWTINELEKDPIAQFVYGEIAKESDIAFPSIESAFDDGLKYLPSNGHYTLEIWDTKEDIVDYTYLAEVHDGLVIEVRNGITKNYRIDSK